jgi:hypothetical protein
MKWQDISDKLELSGPGTAYQIAVAAGFSPDQHRELRSRPGRRPGHAGPPVA